MSATSTATHVAPLHCRLRPRDAAIELLYLWRDKRANIALSYGLDAHACFVCGEDDATPMYVAVTGREMFQCVCDNGMLYPSLTNLRQAIEQGLLRLERTGLVTFGNDETPRKLQAIRFTRKKRAKRHPVA